MGGVLTLDAAFLGSVPADLGKALLERARADCGPVLHRAIESMREPLATMAGYHLGWWNADRSTAAGSSGKYFRAALVYAAARLAVVMSVMLLRCRRLWSWCTTSRCCMTM